MVTSTITAFQVFDRNLFFAKLVLFSEEGAVESYVFLGCAVHTTGFEIATIGAVSKSPAFVALTLSGLGRVEVGPFRPDTA